MMANIFRNAVFDIVDMNKNFNMFNTKLEILTKIEVGDKIGFDSSEHIYINHKSIFQPFIRKYYAQNRQTNIQNLENIMREYKIFLEMVYTSIAGKTICDLLCSNTTHIKLPNKTIALNEKIISGLRNLSTTYKDQDDIGQRIETIITYLDEYKSRIQRSIYFQS
jgi:hypothetical protein